MFTIYLSKLYAACLPISTRNNIDTSYLLSKRLERHSSRVYIRLEITYHKRPALFHFSEIKIKSWFAIFYQIWFSKQQCQYTVCMLSIYRQIGNWSTPKRPDCAMRLRNEFTCNCSSCIFYATLIVNM